MKKMVLGAALATAATFAAVVPVAAATLSNGNGQTCDGSGRWHFVNNQTGGQTGPLTATFNVNGGTSSYTVSPSKVLQSVNHYYVTTEGNARLVSATTGSVPGRLVLSDFSCVGDPKKD